MRVWQEQLELSAARHLRLRDADLPNAVIPTALDRRDFQLDQKQKTEDRKSRIRCPVCSWQPPRTSRWSCLPMGAPEFFAGGCGHRWNTFDTRGCCPGCRYQWKHTSCMRCSATSLHEDWYEKGPPGDVPRPA